MIQKPFIEKNLYRVRNLRIKAMFRALEYYCHGNVLDVGGYDFYLLVRDRGLDFLTWTALEYSNERTLDIKDERYKYICGDGCHMSFENNCFDTVLNIQVLEHVLEPIKMVDEIARVLKPGGHGIFVIPQTSAMHMAPHHYYNFTRFWIKEVMEKTGLEIVEIKPLGGIWSSMTSHLVYFFVQSVRFEGTSTDECKRNIFFYLLYPAMVLYAIISIPICMFLSIGDLTEEPNNYLAIVRKR